VPAGTAGEQVAELKPLFDLVVTIESLDEEVDSREPRPRPRPRVAGQAVAAADRSCSPPGDRIVTFAALPRLPPRTMGSGVVLIGDGCP
jgi:hypothetical protein